MVPHFQFLHNAKSRNFIFPNENPSDNLAIFTYEDGGGGASHHTTHKVSYVLRAPELHQVAHWPGGATQDPQGTPQNRTIKGAFSANFPTLRAGTDTQPEGPSGGPPPPPNFASGHELMGPPPFFFWPRVKMEKAELKVHCWWQPDALCVAAAKRIPGGVRADGIAWPTSECWRCGPVCPLSIQEAVGACSSPDRLHGCTVLPGQLAFHPPKPDRQADLWLVICPL